MSDTFRSRIPTLSDAELRQYVENPLDYRIEAVEAAVTELARRGQSVEGKEWRQMRSDLEQRDAALHSDTRSWFGAILGTSLKVQMFRTRLVTVTLLVVGLGSAALVYLTAPPQAANPLGYEPLHTKKYLRDLELYGGKANVLATEFMRWFEALWHGRSLAFTLAWLTVFAAFGFWFIATRYRLDADLNLGAE
jgi:hypothetical protein